MIRVQEYLARYAMLHSVCIMSGVCAHRPYFASRANPVRSPWTLRRVGQEELFYLNSTTKQQSCTRYVLLAVLICYHQRMMSCERRKGKPKVCSWVCCAGRDFVVVVIAAHSHGGNTNTARLHVALMSWKESHNTFDVCWRNWVGIFLGILPGGVKTLATKLKDHRKRKVNIVVSHCGLQL